MKCCSQIIHPPPQHCRTENYSSRPLRRVHCGTPVALGRGKKKRNGALNDVGGCEDVVVVAAPLVSVDWFTDGASPRLGNDWWLCLLSGQTPLPPPIRFNVIIVYFVV